MFSKNVSIYIVVMAVYTCNVILCKTVYLMNYTEQHACMLQILICRKYTE